MAIRSKLFSFFTLLLAVGAFTVFASAQEAKPADTEKIDTSKQTRPEGWTGDGIRKGGRKGRMGHGGPGMRGLHGIELTDAQKEQVRSIMEANKPSQETLEEIRTLAQAKRNGTVTPEQTERLKQLKAQAREKGQAIHTQIQAILTDEQKAQMEAKKQEMRQKMQEHRQMRQQQKTEPAKPVDN